MNSINISGRLTKDIELKSTPSGVPVCSFTLAVDRPFVKEKVDFVDCVAWRQAAEFVSKYFHKGDGVEVQGVLTTRNYETKEGAKRKAVEVMCNLISFPKGKKKTDGNSTPSQTAPVEGFQQIADEDVPF